MRIMLAVVLSLLVLLATAGCQSSSDQHPASAGNTKEAAGTTQQESEASKRKVASVTVLEAPATASSPAEAVIHQFEVTFQDGKKAMPRNDAVLYETTIGNTSIVAIRSPEGEKNYAIFLYSYQNKWVVNGLLRMEGGTTFADKEGLALPMDKFNAHSLKIADQEKKVWAFADDKQIVTIAVYNRFPVADKLEPKKVMLNNGNEAYVVIDPLKKSYLYYYDTGKMIVVSGTASEAQLIELANSLPSVTALSFPAAT